MNKLLLLTLIFLVPSLAMAQTDWITITGFSPGSSEIPEESKPALKQLVSEYNPAQNTIFIIGWSDTLQHEGKSFLESQSADTLLAQRRAQSVADFYNQLGWRTRIIDIQNTISGFRGKRGVKLQVVDSPSSEIGHLVIAANAKSDDINSKDNDPPNDPPKEESFGPDWSLNTGLVFWGRDSSWSLLVPTASLSFYRGSWSITAGGGFNPWIYPESEVDAHDALAFGKLGFHLKESLSLQTGIMIGWKVLSDSDHWSQKVESIFLGPSYRWKFLEGSISLTMSRMSSLDRKPFWGVGAMAEIKIKI